MPESNPTTEALNTLREKLRDMFHFAHNDLDFGIFRILKIKRDEINQFIDEKLPSIVDEALAEVADALYNSQLTQVKEYVNEYGSKRHRDSLENIAENTQLLIDFFQTEGQEELISPLETNLDDLKAHLAFRVYNHIHSFFEGYYRDGDFGYNDRSTAQYKVNYPDEADYDGTDTLFHWKCRDSYYVKTATGFNSVTFEIEGKRIEYRLEGKASSGTAQNSNRDDFKHYRFDRIDPPKPDDTEPTWRVILHLAETSTPKKVKLALKSDEETLVALEKQLAAKEGRTFCLNSFLLLRDSSELGKEQSDKWVEENMLAYNILRLDWHEKTEDGSTSRLFKSEKSYLDLIFEKAGIER